MLHETENVVITKEEAEAYYNKIFKVITIIPYADAPKRRIFYADHAQLEEFFRNYQDFGEFVVGIREEGLPICEERLLVEEVMEDGEKVGLFCLGDMLKGLCFCKECIALYDSREFINSKKLGARFTFDICADEVINLEDSPPEEMEDLWVCCECEKRLKKGGDVLSSQSETRRP